MHHILATGRLLLTRARGDDRGYGLEIAILTVGLFVMATIVVVGFSVAIHSRLS